MKKLSFENLARKWISDLIIEQHPDTHKLFMDDISNKMFDDLKRLLKIYQNDKYSEEMVIKFRNLAFPYVAKDVDIYRDCILDIMNPIEQIIPKNIFRSFVEDNKSVITKKVIKKTEIKSTITLTFCESGENHKGMQIIGKKAKSGYTNDELVKIEELFIKKGCKCEMIDLSDYLPEKYVDNTVDTNSTCLLIIRNGLKVFCDSKNLFDELNDLDWDKKAFMYGKVVNKNARHNLCFSDQSQEPNYEEGMGRIVSFGVLPQLNKIRDDLPKFFNKRATNLLCEGNMYYDTKKCFIGFHGDTERRVVIGVRLGDTFPLHYQWYKRNETISDMASFMINDSDIYVMCETVTGTNWKSSSIPTLRHAAGDLKNIKTKKAKSVKKK